ncbi:MAG: TIGR02652 family protein [Pseudanabaenaceae cyanobacterium bins.68]|nr:TIGR02652 family protein [Pseudanabaenaceae cyanobacterium bins.68]
MLYPDFGSEIPCPQCHRPIPALILTDAYLCDRHGLFELTPANHHLVHLQSGRIWQRYQNQWYRQHTHPDGLILEIGQGLDLAYCQGWQVIQIAIAARYQDLLYPYLDDQGQLFGLRLEFNPDLATTNFELVKQPRIPKDLLNFNESGFSQT